MTGTPNSADSRRVTAHYCQTLPGVQKKSRGTARPGSPARAAPRFRSFRPTRRPAPVALPGPRLLHAQFRQLDAKLVELLSFVPDGGPDDLPRGIDEVVRRVAGDTVAGEDVALVVGRPPAHRDGE